MQNELPVLRKPKKNPKKQPRHFFAALFEQAVLFLCPPSSTAVQTHLFSHTTSNAQCRPSQPRGVLRKLTCRCRAAGLLQQRNSSVLIRGHTRMSTAACFSTNSTTQHTLTASFAHLLSKLGTALQSAAWSCSALYIWLISAHLGADLLISSSARWSTLPDLVWIIEIFIVSDFTQGDFNVSWVVSWFSSDSSNGVWKSN